LVQALKLPVLDLWSGSKSATQAWADAGHEIISVDIDESSNPTICKDILNVDVAELEALAPDGFAFAWASVDCRIYSLMNMRWARHWDVRNNRAYPATQEAIDANARLVWTLHLLQSVKTPYWVVENPRAMMRQQPFMKALHRETVCYCKYGDDRMKPTDLFGNLPPSFVGQMCKNSSASCHHRSAPRGSRSGTQGMAQGEAQRVPIDLSRIMRDSCIHSDGNQRFTLKDYENEVLKLD